MIKSINVTSPNQNHKPENKKIIHALIACFYLTRNIQILNQYTISRINDKDENSYIIFTRRSIV